METGYKISDIMTNDPIKIKQTETVQASAKVMKLHNVGSLLVMEDKELVGIITERDLVAKVVCDGKDARLVKVNDIMTPAKDMITIDPGMDIYSAMMLMKENEVRRLPVTSKGQLVGLVTAKDILKIQPELFDLVVESYELKEEERKLNLLDQ